jgi:hypothetical protein
MNRLHEENMRLRRRSAGIGIAIALVALTTWLSLGAFFWKTRASLERAQDAYERGDFATAEEIIAKVLRQNNTIDASILAVKLAFPSWNSWRYAAPSIHRALYLGLRKLD